MNRDAHHEGLIDALNSPTASDRVSALLSIVGHTEQNLPHGTIEAITRCLSAESKTVRRRAADALVAAARRDPSLVAAIRPNLKSCDPRIRFGTAYALGTIGSAAFTIDTAEPLHEALGNPDGDVRWAAAELIVQLGRRYPSQIGAELLALARTGNPAARKMSIYCIRDLGLADDKILDTATAAARDDDVHVRLAALALLAETFAQQEAAATLMLERLDTDRDPGVRRAAAIALSGTRCRSARVVEALQQAASQAWDDSLARAARAALERLERS
jgi:HEAT repeat protein